MSDNSHILADPARLAAIAASDLIEGGAIPALDRVASTAARLLDVPVVQLNVITADRQIPISHVGADAWGEAVDLDRSFCQHAIQSGAPLIVEDAREHPLVSANLATRESGLVAYLAIPIHSPRAPSPIATLCVVDFAPRRWRENEVAILGDLAEWALSEIELRAGRLRDRLRAEAALRASDSRLGAIFDGTYEYIGLISPDGTVLDCNRASLEFAGNTREEVIGQPFWSSPWFVNTPGAPERLRVAIAQAASGEFVRYETTLERPTGAPLTFDFSLHPIRDDSGQVILIVPEGRDITDRRRADVALRQSEERYRSLFESLDDGFCVIEMLFDDAERPVDYRFLEANPAFVRQTGLTDAIGRCIRELVPQHEEHWFEWYGRVARTGVAERFEAEARGLGRWYEAYAFRVGAPEERKVAVLFRDVTEERLAAAERELLVARLEVERTRLVEVVRVVPAFMAVLRGPEYVLELVNDAWLELIGRRNVVGRPLFEAVPEARGQGFEERLAEVVATGQPSAATRVPIRLQRTPGGPLEERVVDIGYVPLREADGTRSGIVALGSDVTDQLREQREAEQARDRAERLQALTAALAGARTLDDVAEVVIADMVVALGARTGALAGRAPEGDAMVLLRTIGFPEPTEAVLARQPLDFRGPLVECFLTQAPVWIERRDGPDGLDARFPPLAPIWDVLGVQSAAFVPLVAAGETVGVISFAFEGPRAFPPAERSFLLTLGQQAALAVERARLFDAERDARADAERANLAKSEFLAVMSHELRTPLNAIGGYAELMELGIHGPLTEQQRHDLNRIQQSQVHLLGLINEVLNYARLETGKVHYELEEVVICDAMQRAEALVEPQARAKDLTVMVEPGPPGAVARADGEKVRQILVNLLSNAVKFTNRGGRVDLHCLQSGDEVQVVVRDTGVGIPPDQMERIFEPFVQVRADLTRTAEGTGLGLAISRDLARGMGGDLTAESEPGVGSTFTLRLPGA